MLFLPGNEDFGLLVPSSTARPAAAFGTAFTCSATPHTMGSWAQVFAATTEDSYGVLVCLNSIGLSAARSETLVDIGIDPAGGTSYTTIIPYLMGTGAGTYLIGAMWYYFPIMIPAGCTIAVRGQSVTASKTGRCLLTLFQRPARQELMRVGGSVQALGATAASSTGTAFTPGTTAEGAWTSLGTLTNSCFWFQIGYGWGNDTSVTAACMHMDAAVGNGTTYDQLIVDQPFVATTAEQQMTYPLKFSPRYIAEGVTIYARGQYSGTAETGSSAIVYAVS